MEIPKSHINEERQIKAKETLTNESRFFNKTEIPITKIKMETRKVKFESMSMDIRKFRKKLIGYGYVASDVLRLTERAT